MMAQVLEQEVQHDSVPPIEGVPPDPDKQLDIALTIAEHYIQKSDQLEAKVVKHERKQKLEMTVRYSERAYPPDVLLKLFALRQEINNLNKAQRHANQTILRLRQDVRLRDRVMRLKTEARLEGRGELLAEVTEAAADIRCSPVTRAAVDAVKAKLTP